MEAVRTTLGPRGMDKLIHTGNKVESDVSLSKKKKSFY
jgi:chaperonin GroEL (HSP60 family)